MATEGERALSQSQVKDGVANFRKLRSAVPHVASPILDSGGQLVSDK